MSDAYTRNTLTPQRALSTSTPLRPRQSPSRRFDTSSPRREFDGSIPELDLSLYLQTTPAADNAAQTVDQDALTQALDKVQGAAQEYLDHAVHCQHSLPSPTTLPRGFWLQQAGSESQCASRYSFLLLPASVFV